MPKKKSKPIRSVAAHKASPALNALAKRVAALEAGQTAMRGDMTSMTEDVAALRTEVRQVDERSQKGERVMHDMQLEQRRMSKTVDRIADHFHVGKGSEAELKQTADEKEVAELEAAEADLDKDDVPPA